MIIHNIVRHIHENTSLMFDIEDEHTVCCLNSKVPTYILVGSDFANEITIAIRNPSKKMYSTHAIIAWFDFDLCKPTCIDDMISFLKQTEDRPLEWWKANGGRHAFDPQNPDLYI